MASSLVHGLAKAAKKLSARWTSLSFGELRALLASFLERVVVAESTIQIVFSRKHLRQLLENADQLPANLDTTRARSEESDLIRLDIEAKRRRCGGEVHLLIPPGSEPTATQPRASLVKAVARAHSWYLKVLKGACSTSDRWPGKPV